MVLLIYAHYVIRLCHWRSFRIWNNGLFSVSYWIYLYHPSLIKHLSVLGHRLFFFTLWRLGLTCFSYYNNKLFDFYNSSYFYLVITLQFLLFFILLLFKPLQWTSSFRTSSIFLFISRYSLKCYAIHFRLVLFGKSLANWIEQLMFLYPSYCNWF